jgi:cobalt-zinc-cadmium efflux system protein
VAFFLNLAFTIVEVIGGVLTNSLAILSDAVHDFGDSLSLGLSWYFQKLSNKGRDRTFSYGYKRFSLLGAMINSIVLLVGSILILFKTIPELLAPSETDAVGMMYLSILGIMVNSLAALRLRKGKSLNEKVVSLHLLEDVLGWVAVLIGSVIMIFFKSPIIDPILSLLITSYILYHAFINLKKSMMIVLQTTPEGVDLEKIHDRLQSLEEVIEIHDCHIWSMDGNYNVLTVHLRLNKNYSLEELGLLKVKVREKLKTEPIHHLTIEFESPTEKCIDDAH